MNPHNNNNNTESIIHSKPMDGNFHSKFEIEGPWNIGDPVHEKITEGALHKSNLLEDSKTFKDPKAWEFIRGVLWNDDPEGLLFDNNDTETDNWSSGAQYGIKFKWYESQAKGGKFYVKSDPLLARSHFGDLQCFHAMASKDNVDPQQTLKDILEWCEFLFHVAKGLIDENALIKDTPINNWFPQDYHCTVKKNYLIGKKGNLKERAIGSFMHIVQDSFAKGHVDREKDSWKILEFHSYTHQDSSKHAQEDSLDHGKLRPEAVKAMEVCSEILNRWQDPNCGWEDMKKFLLEKVFELSPDVRPSGPGNFQ